ncbi:hypothetical protein HKD37_20G056497 [Glycine soja]
MSMLYFNGRVYEENDGVIFEGSKKAIQIKREISFNALEKKLEIRFLVSGKYVALQICDDEDVETMIESFQQQQQMSVLELYIEKDVAGGYMFHSANSVMSCGHNLSHNELKPPRNISNLHDDEDDDDYLASNLYVEESLDEDDSVDGISDTDDEVTDIIEPVYKELKIQFEMMFCIITISIGVIRTRMTFAVWRCHRILMLNKNYMLS